MKQKVTVWVLSIVCSLLLITNPISADLLDFFGKAVGGTAIFLLVDNFGKDINSAINHLLNQNGKDTKAATKVVPIISILDGTGVGAVQVTGDKAKVDKVKACLQIESNKTFGSPVRIRCLVPVDKKAVSNVSRIEGVGVSAMIDIKL